MITLHPEKDQHLLTDKKILAEEMRAAELSEEDRVIEIGAGAGILTAELVEKAGKVLAFELDKQFKEELDKLKNKSENQGRNQSHYQGTSRRGPLYCTIPNR